MVKKDQEYLDQLNVLAGDITKRIVKPDYAHLLEMWKAFLGAFVGPEIARLDPDSIDDKRKALMEKYNKEAIKKMFNPEPIKIEVEKIVEKVVEKIVYKDRVVAAPSALPDQNDIVLPQTGAPSTSNRRYRPSVNKVKRAVRSMKPSERENIIKLFNNVQALMDKDDALCANIVKQHNDLLTAGEDKTYPSQVAGYWSWLCRVVLMPITKQDQWYSSAIKKGSITASCPMPIANDHFKKVIIENQEEQQALDAHRSAYKNHMRGAPSPAQDKPSSIGF
jgi:hypothetical protein